MWSACRSSDSSRQSQFDEKYTRTTQRTSSRSSPVVSVGDSLLLSPNDPSQYTHTAPTLSAASLQDSQYCRSSLNKVWHKSVAKPRPNLKHSGGHVTSSHQRVKRTGEWIRHGKWRGAGKPARAQLRRAAYAYTGRINGWYEKARIHMQICK